MEQSTRRVSPEQLAKKWCEISQDQPGFEKKYINQYIGYGLFATRCFAKGDFLLEYRGVHRPDDQDDVDSTYVFEYRHNGKNMLIDATCPNACLARYINDCYKRPNSTMKKKVFSPSGKIHLCLYALCEINMGEEIRYNYGISDLPWRQNAEQEPPESKSKEPAKKEEPKETPSEKPSEDPYSEEKPAEEPKSEDKPAEEPKSEEKPAAEVSKTEDKPAETAESKPSETPENQQTESKPAEDVKPESAEMHAPAVEETKPEEPATVEESKSDEPKPTDESEPTTQEAEPSPPAEETTPPKVYAANEKVSTSKAETHTKTSEGEPSSTKNETTQEHLEKSAACGREKKSGNSFSFVGSGLSRAEKMMVKDLAQKYNCVTYNKFNNSITHVIIKTDENLVCDRTFKYFQGIAKRVWVVSFSWVKCSLENGYLLPEEGFEVQGDFVMGKSHGGPQRARQLANAQGLLCNYEIYHSKPLKVYDEGELKSLIENCGGKFIRSPDLFSEERAGTSHYVLHAHDDAPLPQDEYNDMCIRYGVQILNREWLLDSVSAYTLQSISTYQLSVGNDSEEDGYTSPTFNSKMDRGRKEKRSSEKEQRGANSSDRRNIVTDRGRKRTKQDTTQQRGNSSDRKRNRFPDIQVPVYKKGENKSHCCYVCQKFVQKIPRHLETAHSDVLEVARILALPKNKREHEMERLRLLGNFEHNLQVYCKKKGVYVTLRRSHQQKVAEDYLPCIHCYGFIETIELWRHVKNCKFNETKYEESSDKTVHSQCRMLLEGANLYTTSDFHDVMKDVVDRMHSGPTKDTVKQDKLILNLGKALYNQKGKSKRHYISQKMRQLARLVNEVNKKEHNHNKTLDDLISADMFDEVIRATQALSKPDEKTTMNGVKMSKAPSIGLHLGHLLVKVSMIKRGIAIRMHNDTMKRDAMDFKELYESDWTEQISSPALQTLKENKFFRSENLPLTSDLKKVMKYAQEQINEHYKALQLNANISTWVALEKALFVTISLFNKRRGGVMAGMQTVCVTARNCSGPNEEILKTLSDLEKQLMKRFEVIHLPAKRNRRVPILVKEEWMKAMELLIEKRLECGILKSNPYFFAVKGTVDSYINAWQTLNSYAIRSGCEKPGDVSTTRIRKYTATVVQVLGLDPGELEWLSNHMGHTIDVHRSIYRLHEDIIEVSKVSKLLIAMEEGNVADFKGMTLDEINVKDIQIEGSLEEAVMEDGCPSDCDEGSGPVRDEVPRPDGGKVSSQVSDEADVERNTGSDTDCDEVSSQLCNETADPDSDEVGAPAKKHLKRSPIETDSSDDDDRPMRKGKSHTVGRNRKRRWNSNERKTFNQYLSVYLNDGVMPPTAKLNKVVNDIPRTLAQVRTRANNIIKKKQAFI